MLRILLMVAPFTLRIAISFRRCSHVNDTNEYMPNIDIRIQTIAENPNRLDNASSDCRYLLYRSSSLSRNNLRSGSSACCISSMLRRHSSQVPGLYLKRTKQRGHIHCDLLVLTNTVWGRSLEGDLYAQSFMTPITVIGSTSLLQ